MEIVDVFGGSELPDDDDENRAERKAGPSDDDADE